jgi:hypothetical protein
MASLLSAAKWLRDVVCGHPAPLPPDALLRPLGLNATKLNLLTESVARRLSEVTSLLESGQEVAVERHLFPAAASW